VTTLARVMCFGLSKDAGMGIGDKLRIFQVCTCFEVHAFNWLNGLGYFECVLFCGVVLKEI